MASSPGSIFEEDPLMELEKEELCFQEEEEIDLLRKSNTLGHYERKTTNLAQRSKSLCRQQTAPCNLYTEQKNKRRSISPSFLNSRFNPTHSQPNIVTGKPPSLPGSRHQSMRDLAHQKKPNKPTTPKPKKIGSASSFSSLHKISFTFSTPLSSADHQPANASVEPQESIGGSSHGKFCF